MNNNDTMLLAASNIASRTHDDDSNQNQSEMLGFPKNRDFRQLEVEHHICCHVYTLHNITNWEHIDGNICGNKPTTTFGFSLLS